MNAVHGVLRAALLAALALPGVVLAQDSAAGQGLTAQQYREEFARRRAQVLQFYDTARNPGIAGAAVRYAAGRDLAKADSLLLASDQVRAPRGEMFWMYTVIGTYLHGRGKMSPDAERAVRRLWTSYAPYRGDTENHWLMYYMSLYLAAESWPGEPGPAWYNGRSSDENAREAREYLLDWMRITTTVGQGEFDSPTYLPEYVISMSLLAEFARDGELRRKARMMLDWLFVDFAVDHLDGMYLGGLSREGAQGAIEPRSNNASAFAWLYFLEGPRPSPGWLLYPALSDYELPDIIYRVATDRSAPYVSLERKRVRHVMRHGAERNPPVYKYTYVTRDYGLSSLQGGILQPIQQHTWSVRFRGGGAFSTVFALHPYWSGRELAMFFPEEEKMLTADVASTKGTYNQDCKWTSSSPCERVFQHENTLIALYDIPAGTTSDHIDAFFPATLDERVADSSGWVFCRAADTYIGYYPLRPARWMQCESDTPHWRLRSSDAQNGCVMEVRNREQAGSFERFAAALRSCRPVIREGAEGPAVTYLRPDGRRMEFAYPDRRLLNGEPVPSRATQLFESPFTQARTGGGVLTIMHGSERRVLDFRNRR
jgi:hypothetical protein